MSSARPYARRDAPVWLPTGDQAAAFDRDAIEGVGVPESALMECAGRQSAHLVQMLYPEGEVVALVGGGNNGGDALVALRTLRAWGRRVRAVRVGDGPWPSPLAHGWDLPQLDDTDARALALALEGAAVVVDGLLGTGLRGAPRERHARVIRAVNAGPSPVVSLDVPSGVDANDGAVAGEAVQADLTVAFGWPKLGTVLQPGRGRAGRIVAVEIGFPPHPDPEGAWLITPHWGASRRPARSPTSHKNRVGTLLLMAGGPGMAGAAVLAAGSALRAGVGYLRLASHESNRTILQESVPDASFTDLADAERLDALLARCDAIGVGPGLGTEREPAHALRAVLGAAPRPPIVLDADALNLVASDPDLFDALGGDGGHDRPAVVLTPHPGEMARLLRCSVADVERDRPAAARSLASRTGAVVVLKGAPTLVAEPGGRLGVSGVGGSELAVAGMGDVLTGAVASFLAQGASAVEAAGLALLVTARAAQRLGPAPGLLASDLPNGIPAAVVDLGPGETSLAAPWVDLDLDPPR